MLPIEVVGIFGNHDCAETTLNENDTLSILISAGCLRLVSEQQPWIGKMSGRQVVVGGSSYRALVPKKIELPLAVDLFQGTTAGRLVDSPRHRLERLRRRTIQTV